MLCRMGPSLKLLGKPGKKSPPRPPGHTCSCIAAQTVFSLFAHTQRFFSVLLEQPIFSSVAVAKAKGYEKDSEGEGGGQKPWAAAAEHPPVDKLDSHYTLRTPSRRPRSSLAAKAWCCAQPVFVVHASFGP